MKIDEKIKSVSCESSDESPSASPDVSGPSDESPSVSLDVSGSPSASPDVSGSSDESPSVSPDVSGSSDESPSVSLDVSGSPSASPDVSGSSDKENKIMRWASGYAHNEHIRNSLLIMFALGIIIGGASKELINPLIVYIVGITTPLMILAVVGLIIVVIVAITAVIFSNVIGNVIGGVGGVFVGSVIVDIIIGVIVGVIGGAGEKGLLVIGVLVSLCATVKIMSNIYSRGRRNYIDERVVTDELYKVKCQQWRIFRGLKSNEEKGRLFHLCQQWRFFRGLKNECYIDHIIVCKQGVFCVETKTLHKKSKTNKKIVFKDGKSCIDENQKTLLKQNQIEQVHGNAKWLCGHIKTHCEKLKDKKAKFVFPIITFPGQCVTEEGENGKKIMACNPDEILNKIKGREKETLSDCEVNDICIFLKKELK